MFAPEPIYHIVSQVVNDAATLDISKPVIVSRSVKKGSDWVERVRLCIINRESGGNYRAQNKHSSASGAYQFLDGTWHAVTHLNGSAKDYSKETQDKAFYLLFNRGKGKSHWNYPPKQCW